LIEAFSAVFSVLNLELNFSILVPGLKAFLVCISAILRLFWCQVAIVRLRWWIHLPMNVWVVISGLKSALSGCFKRHRLFDSALNDPP
jgi:hypothetical protein